MEEHAGKLWFGICAGRTVPSARLALAGTRITALDKTNTVMECFMDPSVAKNPDPVWAACHAMGMTLTGPRIPEDVVPSLPQAIWVEFMGIDEKPDSDDYEIAVDLVAGDFYYSPNLKDDGNRKGFALCVQHLTDYIAWTPMVVFIVVLGIYPNLMFKITDAAVIHSLAALGGN